MSEAAPEPSDKPTLHDTPISPTEPRARTACYLTAFDHRLAPIVASWIQTGEELTWLAPGTRPPLTSAKVDAWGDASDHQFLLWTTDCVEPIGYGELNHMPERPEQMWLGHFVVDPAQRGRSHGTRFAGMLLARAFLDYSATDVLLVVFPDNKTAIRCYERVGMAPLGNERKYFRATRQEHLFLRMGITRSRFEALAAAGQLPAESPKLRSVRQGLCAVADAGPISRA
jgi:RimJ/RimL family protein N-acetyltransferase